MKLLAIITLMSLSFGAGWVMRERKKDIEDFEPSNNEEDQSKSMFL